MNHTRYRSMSWLLLAGSARAATLPAAEPPVPPPAAEQAAPASSYQCVDPTVKLHALLRKYALKCGNPACPLCYPPSTPSP